MSKSKTTKQSPHKAQPSTVKKSSGTDGLCSVWKYDKIDRNGTFAFDLNRPDFYHKDYLEKMIEYSRKTWSEIKAQTHDHKGKSKHHYISVDTMCSEAQERIRAMNLTDYSDSFFSFAFNNKLRIFGIRENEVFHVVWYDPRHEICPSAK